jgi:hypothetical protein
MPVKTGDGTSLRLKECGVMKPVSAFSDVQQDGHY